MASITPVPINAAAAPPPMMPGMGMAGAPPPNMASMFNAMGNTPASMHGVLRVTAPPIPGSTFNPGAQMREYSSTSPHKQRLGGMDPGASTAVPSHMMPVTWQQGAPTTVHAPPGPMLLNNPAEYIPPPANQAQGNVPYSMVVPQSNQAGSVMSQQHQQMPINYNAIQPLTGAGSALQGSPKEDRVVRGKYIWENGDVYEGEFVDGVMHGRGVYWYAKSGNKYEGEWFRGVKEGYGRFWNPIRAETYEGSWKDGVRAGDGTMVNAKEGWKYTGTWANNERHGRGVMEGKAGIYEGHWINGRRHGVGKMLYSDGTSYSGAWTDDLYEGEGTFTCPNFTYTGEWRKGEMHGKGQCRMANGVVYLGYFVEGRREGIGEEYLPDGSRYKGLFRNDVREGEGTFQYPNGDHCFGIWHGNHLEGPGLYTAEGKTSMVLYKDDRCIRV